MIQSILHVCGGDPILNQKQGSIDVYSPRVWRWSYLFIGLISIFYVFSTCVEVILISAARTNVKVSILHVCGGDPIYLLD